jgi:hypothetical protein
MPSIISRAYADKGSAQKVKAALVAAGFPEPSITLASGKDVSGIGASVLGSKGAAAAAAAVEAGRSVIVVRAPFGTAFRAQMIADEHEPVLVKGLARDPYVLEDSRNRLSQYILLDHPRYATQLSDVQGRGPISAIFGIPLLSSKRRSVSAYSGTHRFGAFLMPLLSTKKRPISVYQGTRRFGDFLLPLLSRR